MSDFLPPKTVYAFLPNATPFPVRSREGQTLFYLAKTESYHAAKFSLVLLLVVFTGVLLLLAVIHNMAHALVEKYGRIPGISFLVLTLLGLRILTYYFPGIFHFRQYELFDPTIYSSNFILRSLGDLLINALLSCWIILFIQQEIGEYRIPLFRGFSKRGLVILITMTILVATTFLFADIVQSLVADARISFNVTNFFSLTIYSFIGFIILAALAFSYFIFTQILLRLVRSYLEGSLLVVSIVVATIGSGTAHFLYKNQPGGARYLCVDLVALLSLADDPEYDLGAAFQAEYFRDHVLAFYFFGFHFGDHHF